MENQQQLKLLETRLNNLEARLGSHVSGEPMLVGLKNFSGVSTMKSEFDYPNAITLARLCVLAYREKDEVKNVIDLNADSTCSHGWIESKKTDTQGFWVTTKSKKLIIVFRGTSGTKDVITDIKRIPVEIEIDGEIRGKAHEGFLDSVKSVWAQVCEVIKDHADHQIWFTGHSLGGALATLSAYLVWNTMGKKEIIGGLCTFGQPRVLASGKENEDFTKELGPDKIFRIYKAVDPVPLVPWWGYKHVSGVRCYITRNDRFVFNASAMKKVLDRAFKLARIIKAVVLDFQIKSLKSIVSDHYSQGYVDALVFSRNLTTSPSLWGKLKSWFDIIKIVTGMFAKPRPPIQFESKKTNE